MMDADDKNMWLCLPDSLVLHIFTYLSSAQLLRAAQACKAWLRISRDELLWKALLYMEWRIDRCLPLPPGHSSFFREFRRLRCHVPCLEVQVLHEHTDQVLHVSFSHNGKLFATCSKDGTIKVWKVGPPIALKYSRAMKDLFRWQYTQFSQFNASDTLLLVSGVHFGPNSTSGEIAVFNLKDDFALQARVLNKPYDIFGCWLNNAYLLSGNLHYLDHLSSCSALWLNKATQEVLSEQESVVMRLFKFLNINASSVRTIVVANCRNLGKGEEYAQSQAAVDAAGSRGYGSSSSSHAGRGTGGPAPDSSESEPDGKAGTSYMDESDTEMTASESDVGLSGSGMELSLGSSRELDSSRDFGSSRDLGQGSSRDPGQGSSRDPDQGSSRDPGQGSSRDLGQGSSKDLSQGSSRDLGQCLSRDLGQGSSRDLSQGSNCSCDAVPRQGDAWPLLHQSQSDPCLPLELTTDQARKARAIANINQLYQQQQRLQQQQVQLTARTTATASDEVTPPASQGFPPRQCPPKGAARRTSPVKRDVSNISGTPPDALRKSLRMGQAADNPQPGTSYGASGSARSQGDSDACHRRLWLQVQQAEMRRGGENYDEELFRILIEGVSPNEWAGMSEEEQAEARPSGSKSDGRRTGGSSKGGACKEGAASNNQSGEGSRTSLQPLDLRDNSSQSCAVSSSRCSSSDALLSSPDCDHPSLTFAAEGPNAGDIIRAWGKHFTFGSSESLDDEPPIRYPDQQPGFERGSRNSGQPDSEDPMSSSSGMSDSQQTPEHGHRTRVRRRKAPLPPREEHQHLIFTRGSQAYTPHQIGIKRIDSTMADTLRGPLGASKQLEEAREAGGAGGVREEPLDGQEPPGGLEFDKVDHVIELNGHAIGMVLSPDHRYLYVNCRCWPRDYIISDPLTPPPIAQEIEIRVYDLVNLTEVKRFNGHKAFSPNDEINFIFLDVSDLYVASGAEDRQGYVWDRYYGNLLAVLAHRDVVNSVAFNPRDPEMMITASDDHTLKVWFSRHKASVMNTAKGS